MDSPRVAGVSRQELERRWGRVRDELEALGVQALIACGSDNLLGGYVRWLTDAPISYRKVVVFYPGDLMTLIEHGAAGTVRRFNGDHEDYPGIGEVISVAEFPSVHYSQDHEARELVRVLRARGVRSVGLVNAGGMPYALVKTLRETLPEVRVTDCSDTIDQIKAIKSPEELDLIRKTAVMQDACFDRVLRDVRPGMRDFDIAAMMQEEGRRHGGEGGIALAGSAAPGQPAMFQPEHKQGRILKEGDQFAVLIENSGPGGYFLELVRPVVLGKASQALLEAWDFVREAQAQTLKRFRPGTACADIYREHNAFMKSHRQPEERRVYSHGQGYDMVERPLIRDDEPMLVAEGMCLTVHPSYGSGEVWVTITDNYVVGPNGVTDCLHRTEKRVFEI